MKIFNIDSYLAWRKDVLYLPVGELLDTPRGECTVAEDFVIIDDVCPGLHMNNRELEDAEYNLIMHGTDQTPEWKKALYHNDDELYQAYKSLNIASLATNGKRRDSRKNIIFNAECCLCYWQLRGDTLRVISRSWDLQRAGFSDLVIVNRAAHELGCKKIMILSLCGHVYTDREHIARRKDADTGI